MPQTVRVATPTDFLPRYACPYCGPVESVLSYSDTDPETHENLATCARCGRHWLITATSSHADPETARGAGHAFTMRELP